MSVCVCVCVPVSLLLQKKENEISQSLKRIDGQLGVLMSHLTHTQGPSTPCLPPRPPPPSLPPPPPPPPPPSTNTDGSFHSYHPDPVQHRSPALTGNRLATIFSLPIYFSSFASSLILLKILTCEVVKIIYCKLWAIYFLVKINRC